MCWLSFEAHSQSNLIILKNVGFVIFNPCQFCNTSATKQIGTSISRRALCGQVISDGHHRHGSLDKNQSVRHCHQCIWHAFNDNLRQPSLISLMLYLVPSPAHYKNSFFRSRKKGRPSNQRQLKSERVRTEKKYIIQCFVWGIGIRVSHFGVIFPNHSASGRDLCASH